MVRSVNVEPGRCDEACCDGVSVVLFNLGTGHFGREDVLSVCSGSAVTVVETDDSAALAGV